MSQKQYYSPLGQWLSYPQERFIWDGLREIWPQLNEKTLIELVQGYEVNLVDRVDLVDVWQDDWIYKPIWKHGIRAWFVRLMGVLFNEPHWFNFGSVELVKERGRIIPIAKVKQRTIQLKHFGAMTHDYRSYDPYHTEISEIAAGYDIQTDKLFIRLLR